MRIRKDAVSKTTGGARQRFELTEREREVLRLLLKGLSNKKIAKEFFISEATVENHLSNIYRKLGVHSRMQAALLAVRLGIATL